LVGFAASFLYEKNVTARHNINDVIDYRNLELDPRLLDLIWRRWSCTSLSFSLVFRAPARSQNDPETFVKPPAEITMIRTWGAHERIHVKSLDRRASVRADPVRAAGDRV